jgi:hypothetical protein
MQIINGHLHVGQESLVRQLLGALHRARHRLRLGAGPFRCPHRLRQVALTAEEIDKRRRMAVPGDAPGKVFVEVGVTPDVVDDENRATPETGRRQGHELSQGGAVAGG